ncbi:restriction endonuclease subunit S [Mycoplasma suis]|uniref:restriction endonuclease subunit S n=1 Tax=Mycoplasma suis TaxID=57372 RepID=UPI0003222502|nr:restriction endonuclease subunit S [Mycoplasma suis]
MGSNWEWVTLDKLGTFSTGKNFENKYSYFPTIEKIQDRIFFVDGNAIKNFLYIKQTQRYYHKRKIKNLPIIKIFPKNTVCFVNVGSFPGQSSITKDESCISNNIYGFNSLEKISDPKFIKYSFDFAEVKKQINSFSFTTTKRNALPLHKLCFIKFPKPPLEIQQKIGEILSRYDLILDNHERQIELLKNLKVSLFKEWFVKLRFPDYESHSIRGGYLKAGRESK